MQQAEIHIYFTIYGRRIGVALEAQDGVVEFVDGKATFTDEAASRRVFERMTRIAVVRVLPPPKWHELHETRNCELITRTGKEYDEQFRDLFALAETGMSSPLLHYWDSERDEWVDVEFSIAPIDPTREQA